MRALCGLRSVEKERPLSPSPKFHLQEGEGQLGLEGLAMGAAGILFGSCFAATTWSLPFVQNSSARTALSAGCALALAGLAMVMFAAHRDKTGFAARNFFFD